MPCTVTGTLSDAGLSGSEGVKIWFTPAPVEITSDGTKVVAPDPVEVITGTAGAISISLMPGSYTMTIFGERQAYRTTISVPDAATAALADLLEATQPIYVLTQAELAASMQVYLDDAEAARDAAQGARDTAEVHKLAAQTAASSAANTAAALTGFDLEAIAASKGVTAVDVFIYDTSRDSDGGAWRKRTQHTSWYNETLNTATRGARREFPAVAVIVAESNKVTIYDGDDPSLPMWRVTNRVGPSGQSFWRTGVAVVKSITALNGKIVFVTREETGTSNQGVLIADFAGDILSRFGGSVNSGGQGLSVADDSSTTAVFPQIYTETTKALASFQSNDVAMTVLPDAPIAPATGLPVPSRPVGTAGGLSVIRDAGTVADSASTAAVLGLTTTDQGVWWITSNSLLFATWDDIASGDGFGDVVGSTTAGAQAIDLLVTPASITATADGIMISGAQGAMSLAPDYSDFAASMAARVTSTHNTGWMPGDIKGAFLADTDDADLVGGTDADRSVNGNDLTVMGTITRSPVATGAELVWYELSDPCTVTLGADISATGAVEWWEEVGSVPTHYLRDLSGGTSYVNGVPGVVPAGSVSFSGADMTIEAGKKLALMRPAGAAKSASQVAKTYEDERKLFEENAAATLYGASDAVTALAHDDSTDLLHVGTSAGRSVFSGLRRVANTTTPVTTAIAASGGLIVEQ